MALPAGHIIDGKYKLVRLIGTGGMGAVYEGENLLIRRRVAIKVLHAAATGNTDAIRRFEREAQAAGEIGNDHILEVIDLGAMANGDRYLVMEYLDGETLAARIERHGRLEPAQIAPIARQFLTALASAHAAGIIHRDLKPENIFILRSKAGRADFVKLIDFGISKFSRPFGTDEVRMTRADAVLGTPCYMSPEQARGAGEAGVRSDIYSCGVILFESVTGRLPFEGESFNDLMFKIALNDAPSPLIFVPSLDPDFAWLVNRATARDPDARFGSAQEFAEALDDWMRKNSLTETLALPRPSDAFPARARQNSQTISPGEDPPARTKASKSGNDELWAHARGKTTNGRERKKKVPRIAAASIGGLLAIGFAIAVVVRADPPPGAVHAAGASAASLMIAPPEPEQTGRTLATSATPPGLNVPAAGAPSAAVSASSAPSSPRLETAVAKAAAAAPRPVAPATAAPDKPKPKPAAPAKAFDFGY